MSGSRDWRERGGGRGGLVVVAVVALVAGLIGGVLAAVGVQSASGGGSGGTSLASPLPGGAPFLPHRGTGGHAASTASNVALLGPPVINRPSSTRTAANART